MGLSALRLAAVPLAVAFLLPSLPASPSESPASARPVRASLRFQESFQERLVRYREDGESWLEEAYLETYKIKAVAPIDPEICDVSAFGPETEFYFEVGESYYSGMLGDDPRYRAGDRSARVVVDEEEWYDARDNEHYRPIVVVNLKWTDRKWTMSVVQRPYKDWMTWEDEGSWIAAPDWTDLVDDYSTGPGATSDPDLFINSFEVEMGVAGYFALGSSTAVFDSSYSGVTRMRVVTVDAEEGEVYDLDNVRLRGRGVAPPPPDDEIAPTLSLDLVEEQRDGAGALEGLYVSGSIADEGSSLFAVTARVDGGPPIVLSTYDLWFDETYGGITESTFDGFVPVGAPSGTIEITVFDLAKNSDTITIPYGSP